MVVCAAPAAASVDEFVRLAQDAGWLVRVIATPMGERFIGVAQLAALTGDRVRIGFRMPDEPDELPPANAVVVAPATFNTVNKWAAGITDTFATGLLCELTGLGVPIVAVPLVRKRSRVTWRSGAACRCWAAWGCACCSIRRRRRSRACQAGLRCWRNCTLLPDTG